MSYFTFYVVYSSSKFSMYFTFTICFHVDQSHFKCSLANSDYCFLYYRREERKKKVIMYKKAYSVEQTPILLILSSSIFILKRKHNFHVLFRVILCISYIFPYLKNTNKGTLCTLLFFSAFFLMTISWRSFFSVVLVRVCVFVRVYVCMYCVCVCVACDLCYSIQCNKYLLTVYYVPHTLLGTCVISVNITEKCLCLWILHFSGEGQ